jgi:hypothetical protein
MAYSPSAPSTYFDKTGHLVAPRLLVEGKSASPVETTWISAKEAALDNGSLQYGVKSTVGRLAAGDRKEAGCSAIYGRIEKTDGRWTAGCRLTVTGRFAPGGPR